MDFRQQRAHHQDQADRDRGIRCAHRDAGFEPFYCGWGQLADADSNRHRQEYPQGQVSILGGEFFHRSTQLCGGGSGRFGHVINSSESLSRLDVDC